MQQHNIPDDIISYTLTKAPVQAYVAEREREKLLEMRVVGGVSRAHIISGGAAHHTSQHNPPIVL